MVNTTKLELKIEDSDIRIAAEDLAHHTRHFGTSKRLNPDNGKHENYVPTPVELVKMGVVGDEYLASFTSASQWFSEICEHLASLRND